MWELLRIKMQKKSGQAAVEFKTSQFCLVNSELRSAYFHTTRLLQCENLANFTWKDWILLLVQNRKNLYSIRHGLPMKHLSIQIEIKISKISYSGLPNSTLVSSEKNYGKLQYWLSQKATTQQNQSFSVTYQFYQATLCNNLMPQLIIA